MRRLVARPERIAVLDSSGLDLPDHVVPIMPVQNSLMLATLLARAEAVIAPDNGALHLATLLGTPTLGLFGPTSPKECQLPGGKLYPICHREFPCHPCGDAVCSERHCLLAITPGEVAGALTNILDHGVKVG